MIKCKQCGCEYLPIWKEGYPGGAETGATILIWGLGWFFAGSCLCAMGFALDVVQREFRESLCFFGVLLLLIGVLKLASIPDNMKVILQHGGNRCPNCDAWNELHWYD